jgi:hypothetical protein
MSEMNNSPSPLERGQALVEYALIVTLVIISFGLALAATGPVIGNIFSNQIFNLVGADPNTVAELPDAAEFWLTVTWVATQTPEKRSLATRTIAPPTPLPTAGTPPSATPITPTLTPSPTYTPSPSPTPEDIGHVAPWSDSANPDQFINWRLDTAGTYFGSEDWHGTYYPNRTYQASPDVVQRYNSEIDENLRQRLSFNWGNGAPVTGFPSDNFSVIFRRPILITGRKTLEFDLSNIRNMGIRVYLVGHQFGGNADPITGGPAGCSAQKVRWNTSVNVNTAVPTGAVGSTPAVDGRPVPANNTYIDGTSSTVPTPIKKTNRADRWQVYDDGYFGYNPITNTGTISTECLVIDRWVSEDSNRSIFDVRRTVQAANPGGSVYLLVVELSHLTNEARIENFTVRVVDAKTNRDDAVVNNAGAVVANAFPECNWGQFQTNRSNSLQHTWDEFAGGDFRDGTRCHLELRGWVEIPAGMPSPHLVFWDAWDIRAGVSQWVEIADYDPNNDGVFNPATETQNWQRINLRSGNTYNYTWTHNTIDLSPYLASIPSRKVALRFGMQRNAGTSGTMKWYIDTISIGTVQRQSFYMNQSWDLNTVAQANDFIASGNWALTSERAMGSGMAWHESVNATTRRFYEQRTNAAPARFEDANTRIHSIEFNGFIDLDDPLGQTDSDGHQGDPLLTFFHSYNLGQFNGLEIQYTTAPYGIGYPNWQVVPNGGQLHPRDLTTQPDLNTFEEVKINLKDIPARRFRLRFAFLINTDGTERGGWYIDNIRLERDGRPTFLTYPYVDTAEDPATLLSRYVLTGQWDRVEGGNRPATGQTGYSYHDSPAGQYPRNTISLLAFKEPLDLYNDTPENSKSPACNLPTGLCISPSNSTPTNPVFSFWHRRLFNAGVTFSVQWKRVSESNATWRTLWAYEDGMNVRTISALSSDRARKNVAWEYVEIDMRPIYAQLLADNANTLTDADKTDDDIQLRFYFQTRNFTQDDGVYIDDIRIQDRTEIDWKLWESGQQKNDLDGNLIRNADGTPALGDLKEYYDTLDFNSRLGVAWFDTWTVGGGWQAISFEQHDGVLSFHDSVTDMTSTTNRAPDNASEEGTNGGIVNQSFNVLEMKTIIDLRGVLSTERPIMYFWSRWYGRANDRFGVQISVEDPNNALGGCVNGAPQCYDKQFGWGPWETVWSRYGDPDRTYTWERQQVDLSPYARGVAENGKRIKVRFITDALTSGTHRDGWYIDEVYFTHYNPRIFVISKTAATGGVFVDKARNTLNWVTEGKWGLTPTIFFGGSGGSPDSLGGNPWQFRIWDFNTIRTRVTNCGSIDFRDCANTFLNLHANTTTAWHSGLVSEIRENWGSSGPRNSVGTRVTDRFVYRWEMTTPSNLVPNKYTFITASDDGIRVKYDTVPTGGLPAPQADDPPNFIDGSEWNIVNNWQNQSRTTTISSARIEAFKSYRFVVEYFEGYGDASVQLSIGSFNFSFTSAPPGGSGRLQSEQVPTLRNSNASLILNGVLDLRDATEPYLTYYTYHELGGTARVEVSVDGGFTWQQDGLAGSAPPNSIWATPWYGFYWNTRNLDFDQPGGWKNIPDPFNFSTFNFNGSPAPQKRNDGTQLNFNWGSGRPHPNVNADNVSVRWIRKLATTGFTTLKFTTTSDDGVRVWINYSPGCAVFNNNPAQPIFSGGPRVGDQRNAAFNSPNAGCLLIDDWEDQGGGQVTAVRSVPPGAWIMVDYYEAGGGASFRLDIVQGNFDSPNYGGTYMPDNGGWRQKTHDLTSYAGAGAPFLSLRFRLDRRTESSTNVSSNNSGGATFDYLVAWWLTEFEIADP